MIRRQRKVQGESLGWSMVLSLSTSYLLPRFTKKTKSLVGYTDDGRAEKEGINFKKGSYEWEEKSLL